MDFSTMVLTMYIATEDDPDADERILGIAVEESLQRVVDAGRVKIYFRDFPVPVHRFAGLAARYVMVPRAQNFAIKRETINN